MPPDWKRYLTELVDGWWVDGEPEPRWKLWLGLVLLVAVGVAGWFYAGLTP